MARLATTLLVLALLGGTAAAFAVTEGLKLQQSPILDTQVDKLFSPACRCPKRVARIAFRLRRSDRLTLTIENARGRTVRLLFENRPAPAGFHAYGWNGRLDSGARAPDGTYRPRLELDDADRSILLPNRIAVDTVAPRVKIVGARLVGARLAVRYRVSEPAHGLLYIDGRRIVKTYRQPLAGVMEVNLLRLGFSKRPGIRIAVAAVDPAGNRSRPVRVFRLHRWSSR